MSYPGSKAQAGVFQRIIGQMPPHSVYVEPFFGSGQVFWRKLRSARSIIMDLDPDLLAIPGAETGVEAIAGNALLMLPTLIPALPAEAVIYCDPPYLLSTRKHRIYYANELSDEGHKRLLMLLSEAHCNVLISGYPSDLYSSHLQNWRCLTYRTRTRGRTVTECLWCNFPEPVDLHDWRFAGKNFRERLYLRRLECRWLAKLEAMPPRKRNFLLHAVQQRWSQL
jgi:DNA adenine methylase